MRWRAISLPFFCASFLCLTTSFAKPEMIKLFLFQRAISATMNEQLPIRVTPEMKDYILLRTTDLRVATTCEGPLIFSVKTSPPKPTDLVVAVGDRKVYVSAIQAQHIKAIDERMLPRCALEQRRK